MKKYDETIDSIQNAVDNLDLTKLPPLGHPAADIAKNFAVQQLKNLDVKKGIKDMQNLNKKIKDGGLLAGIGSLFQS